MSQTTLPAPDVYQNNIVIDGLLSAPPAIGHVRHFVESGFTAGNWTVSAKFDDALTAINKIIPFYWLLEQFPDEAILVETSADIERAHQERKLGIILGFQGAGAIGNNIQLLRVFHRLGVRIIALTYNERNQFGAGCTEPSDGGLTSLGIQAVQEMNRLGIVQDLTHLGKRTSLEAIEISSDPTVFTHSNPAALFANPRNITDEQIRACAAKGGVIGLATFSAFVGETEGGRNPQLEDYLRQMDYVLDLVGPDHVAIGTDILLDHTDGVWWRAVTGRLYPEVSQGMTFETHNIDGFMHHADYPSVAQAMLDRGYDEETVRKIIGGNFMRVFRQVWDRT